MAEIFWDDDDDVYSDRQASKFQRNLLHVSYMQKKCVLIIPAALGHGVHSASNRNEYQKQENNVSGE
jgi:hypothetical protein